MKGLKYIVLVGNIVIFAVLSLVLPICFEENDDVVMLLIANGGYSGTPDGHLVFINIIYGAVLAALYSMTKAVEWYTLSFAVIHVLSMSVLAYFVLTVPHRAKWERILWLLVLYVLWARIIAALQFTTTAGLCCLAGCVLLLRDTKKARWTGVLFVLIASLIRITAAGLVGVLMAPIILYAYRSEWRRYIPLAVMMLLVIGCRMINSYVYRSDPAWNYYATYNILRGQVTDNPNAYTLCPDDMPEGIDWTDYQLLLRFIPDPEQIDLAAIQKLQAVVGKTPLREKWKNITYLHHYTTEMILLLALMVLLIITTSNPSKRIFFLLYTLFIGLLMVYVSIDGYLKNRVFICMLLPVLMVDYLLLPDSTGRKQQWSIIIVLLALSGWYGYQTNCDQIDKRHRRHIWEDTQMPLLEQVPADVTVATVRAGMCLDAANPWHLWPYSFRKYTLGYLTWSPLNTAVGQSYRVFLRDDMLIFTISRLENNSYLEMIREQIEKHYGITTEVEVLAVKNDYAILRLNSKL